MSQVNSSSSNSPYAHDEYVEQKNRAAAEPIVGKKKDKADNNEAGVSEIRTGATVSSGPLQHQNTMRPSEKQQRTSIFQSFQARTADEKIVGLKNYGMNQSTTNRRRNLWLGQNLDANPSFTVHQHQDSQTVHALNHTVLSSDPTIEELEDIARDRAETNPIKLLLLGNMAALKVMGFYLITLETIIVCAVTAGLTVYWYFTYQGDTSWNGGGLDFILLAFAVTSPISAALGMAFARRERALVAIAEFRSFSYHLFLAHCLWDWNENGGRAGAAAKDIDAVDWVEHCDAVMAQLIGIGDELSRFLSLPTTSRSRNRLTRQGRKEAARTTEVAYHLLESMSTQRMTRLIFYSERLKKIGLPSGEVSRIRQYERFLSDRIEQLRMVKMYRTPQALRSFARVFTLLLPPFYAPTYAQVAREVQSLGVGIAFGIITALGLTALFESLQVLEDPFTAFLALDGIDVREEFEVLHFAQLASTRRLAFPNAPAYPIGRRAALVPKATTVHKVGYIPSQRYHQQHNRSEPSILGAPECEEVPDEEDRVADFEQRAVDVELGFPLTEVGNGPYARATAYSESEDTEHYLRARSRALSESSNSFARRRPVENK